MTPTKRKIFSIPLNPYTTKEDFDNIFVPFLKKNADWIYDVYFTSRIPPFMQDAMGATFDNEALKQMFNNALALEKATGVRVSATFNNIKVPPTAENLEIFCSNLKYLYEGGLRSMTQPHNHWMMTGTFKELFPELQVKNTVLNRVSCAQDFWNACEAGYDYVNIDRILLRDEEALKSIKKAQLKFQKETGKYVPTALLANEGCRGKCPVMNEHYNINSSSGSRQPGTDKPYFYQKISEVSCPKWRLEDPAYSFKMGNIPPFRADFERLLENVDVIKMHGREGFGLLNDTIKFVESYINGDEELHDISIRGEIEDLKVNDQKLQMWRKHIRTCKFECWDCHLCDELVASAQKKKDQNLGTSIDDLINNFEG
ncbi:MAG: hypothetical protein DRH57_06945 [Candidatus Cloacimonadota bacterium]|nr:MAG: hypothetical protein DRH57_06945 [Candidatus Cloacimonadota bacterium]